MHLRITETKNQVLLPSPHAGRRLLLGRVPRPIPLYERASTFIALGVSVVAARRGLAVSRAVAST